MSALLGIQFHTKISAKLFHKHSANKVDAANEFQENSAQKSQSIRQSNAETFLGLRENAKKFLWKDLLINVFLWKGKSAQKFLFKKWLKDVFIQTSPRAHKHLWILWKMFVKKKRRKSTLMPRKFAVLILTQYARRSLHSSQEQSQEKFARKNLVNLLANL